MVSKLRHTRQRDTERGGGRGRSKREEKVIAKVSGSNNATEKHKTESVQTDRPLSRLAVCRHDQANVAYNILWTFFGSLLFRHLAIDVWILQDR